MTTKRDILAVLALVTGLLMSFAPLQAAETGGVRSVFELGASTRALGMGGTGVALGDEGAAFLLNPAVLAAQRQREASSLHATLFEGTTYDALSFTNPFGRAALGVAGACMAVDGIHRTDVNVVPLEDFGMEHWQVSLGGGFAFGRRLRVGGLAKYRRLTAGDLSDSGLGVDAGVLFHLASSGRDLSRFGWRNLSVGVAAVNLLSPELRLDESSDLPPLRWRPGLSWRYVSSSMASALWLAAEADRVEKGGAVPRLGLEYALNQRFFARGGWDGTGPTAGAGFSWRGARLDYGFAGRELGASHRFSLSYRFGHLSDDRLAQRLATLKTIARTYEDAGEYPRAVASWRKALDEAPSDPEAAAGIRRAEHSRNEAVNSRLERARKALAANDIPRAVPDITWVLGVDPGNTEAKKLMTLVDRKSLLSQNYLQGLEAFEAEDYASAVRFFEMVRAVDPLYRDTARLYGEAKSHLAPLESLPPEVTKLYATGVDHFLKGEYDQAIAAWNRVLEKAPGHYLVQRNISEARERQKNRGAAKEPPAREKKP